MITDGLHDLPAGKVAMVVTHLEMTAPAPLRGAPLAEGITFLEVIPDLAWYRDIFERVGSEWLWTSRLLLQDKDLMAILGDPNVLLFTLSRDGRDEALLELDFRQEGECELAFFGLTSALIGTGAGGHLMDRAIEIAWSRPINRLHVHTCTIDSPQALAFYQRSGFSPYRRQIEIGDDPRLEGLLPEDAGPHYPLIR
ncbi:MAG: GNAT family N-acetyltransferase [Sulfitobacter sp.]|nr:GNAT family N-acetyltransferase [Sulfitobacter sp.]